MAVQNVKKDGYQSQDQDVRIDTQFDVTLEHADTGERYSTRQIVNEAAPVDFPGAYVPPPCAYAAVCARVSLCAYRAEVFCVYGGSSVCRGDHAINMVQCGHAP